MTCDRGREGKCAAEVLDLFGEVCFPLDFESGMGKLMFGVGVVCGDDVW